MCKIEKHIIVLENITLDPRQWHLLDGDQIEMVDIGRHIIIGQSGDQTRETM